MYMEKVDKNSIQDCIIWSIIESFLLPRFQEFSEYAELINARY